MKRIAIALIWWRDRLLVGRRGDDVVLAGRDEFPGGKCEPGEKPSAAVVREWRYSVMR